VVYGVAARIAERAISGSGIRLIGRGAKLFQRYDVKIHRGLYGQAGGRGVRHGRDIGSVVAGLYREYSGDDLDASVQPGDETTSRKFPKTYRGNQRGSNRRFTKRDGCYRFRKKSR